MHPSPAGQRSNDPLSARGLANALKRFNLSPFYHPGGQNTRIDDAAIEQNRARSAFALTAAFLDCVEPAILTQDVKESS